MAHRRLRPFASSPFHPGSSGGADLCMAVRAGKHVFLRGQSGWALDGGAAAPGDAAGQAEVAMRNVAALLAEAGAGLSDIRKLTTYVTDRAWREPVAAVVARHLAGAAPAETFVVVAGLEMPGMLVALDVEAVAGA